MRIAWLILLPAALWAADEAAPAWAKDAAAKPAPAYSGQTPAVVLFQEESLTVDPEGKRVFVERAVIRRLISGRVDISASRAYNVKSGRIRDLRAWVIHPDGKEVRFGKDRIEERALDRGSVYDEARMKMIDPGDAWRTGSSFAYEIVEEEKTVFAQHPYYFQSLLPVLTSRFSVTLPPGWEQHARIFNHATVEPVKSGNTTVWELKNLPWIEPEEYGPGYHSVVPRLALNYYPDENRAGLRPLRSWSDVSDWMSQLTSRQADLTPALQNKAAQLTTGAKSDLDKLKAIAAFVQQTNYISVQMNLTRGGGYVPHPADDVLRKNYGDCKDKANLMKALLASAGIGSHLVAVYSGDRDFTRPEWPSTFQFNHMILAARVSPDVRFGAVKDHPDLGRLLFFDPTDPYTPLGDLPDDEQGSHALVIAGGKGDLVAIPRANVESNRAESTTTAVMDSTGGLKAKRQDAAFGQAARSLRSLLRGNEQADIRKYFERRLSWRLGGITLNSITPADSFDNGRVDVQLDFAALQFGKMMMDRLLIIAPGALAAGSLYVFPARERKLPVRMESAMRKDSVIVEVPAGFVVDEMPPPVEVRSNYGNYKALWKAAGTKVEFEHTLVLNDFKVPASEYGQVRAFFERVAGAATSSVVLVKK